MRGTRDWLSEYGSTTFGAWDFKAALPFAGVAFGLTFVKSVHQAAVPVLFAEVGVGVAMTATVFAALALFATFYDGSYRLVLERAGGLSQALMPYVTICVVAAVTALLALIAALALPAFGTVAAAFGLGVPTLFCTWTITGSISLAELTYFHAKERAELMAGADEAERQRMLRRAS
jgi:hypothetical protein